MMCNGEPLHSLGPVCQRTTAPTTRRISNRPAPGQPPAKVEYRRRNTDLDTIIGLWPCDVDYPAGCRV
jgi:hypothetical protein